MTSIQSHSGSSDGEYEDDTAMPEAHWESQLQLSAHPTPFMESSTNPSAQPAKPAVPMQKRRRVTRACDECRRKKIKCDGKQPCTHCTVYSYECTYDQPSNRRRNPAPHYVEALENRLQRAEALLRTVLPDVDLSDPSTDNGVPRRMHSSMRKKLELTRSSQARPLAPIEHPLQGSDGERESMLESMVANTGLLDLDDEGNWDFHGHSSGRAFLKKMREQFGDLVGKDSSNGPAPLDFMRYKSLSPSMDSPRYSVDSPLARNLPITHELPSKQCAQLLCENALDDAGAIVRIVHLPTFYAMLNRVYDTPNEQLKDEDNKFVALLYGVIALGALFCKAEQSQLMKNGYENAIDQGYHWFRVSRQLVDLTDCRDLTSLQTILYMILFLQSSARLSTCYSYLGIALRSAIRMGLHRSVSNLFNPVERELRKRIFWIIRKLDIYVGALLGLPQMLSNDDIDQEMPLEVDDDYITVEKVSPMPSGKLSIFVAFNAHTRLVQILSKTVKYIYPIKGNDHSRTKSPQSYVVSHSKIREIEQDLQSWMEKLPMPFRPGEEATPEFMRIRHILRMAYAHIHLFLYRPFLHYISQSVQARQVDKRSYACAAACVSVSRNIIHLTAEMKKRGLLVGSYWFYMYTTFFAIISLLFYALENPQDSTGEEVLKDAHEGRDTLAGLAARSLAADRCSQTLNGLFEKIPGKLHKVRNSSSQKKRQAPSQLPLVASRNVQSAPDVLTMPVSVPANATMRRASDSPTQQDSWRRTSIHQEPSNLRHQVVNTMDAQYHRNSQDPYSSANTDSPEMQTPHSPSTSLAPNTNQASFGMQNPFSNQVVPDLTAMMFPSADPFAYPNQPMTTLENRQFIKQEQPRDSDVYRLAPTTGVAYDGLHSNMFRGISPYLMQGQQTGFGMQSMNDAPPTITSLSMDAGGWQQQPQILGGTPDVNLDQLFGEDWGGWMNQGHRQ